VKYKSSAGFPSLKRKEYFKTEMERFVSTVTSGVDFRLFFEPFVVFNRTQAKDDGSFAIRPVYCPTWRVTLLEIMFGKSALEHFMSADNSDLILGKTQLQVSEKMKSLSGKHKLCLDFKKFDQTLNPYILISAFDLLAGITELGRLHQTFWSLVSHIMFGLIYHPKVGFVRRTRGLVSGSYFTNLVDGISNLLIC